jgi:hypothetical protein
VLPSFIVTDPIHAGEYAALLGDPSYPNDGGCPVGDATLAQTFDVPTGGWPYLKFWYCIHSYDTLDFDYFAAFVVQGQTRERVWYDGRVLWDTGPWSSGWRQGTVSLARYAGKAITVEFSNVMSNADGWYNTWTYLDDVRVVDRLAAAQAPGPRGRY